MNIGIRRETRDEKIGGSKVFDKKTGEFYIKGGFFKEINFYWYAPSDKSGGGNATT